MCELLGMSSDRNATLNLSLLKLAEHGGFSGPHKDGWGVAYYEGADIRLIKDAAPAADNDWVRFIGEHDLRSRIVVAHIRYATMGERAYRNTQPFMRELAGRMHLFAHNGWLPAIVDTPALSTQRFQPVGETDSEQAFCALLDRMAGIWARRGQIPPLEQRMQCVSRFAAELRRLGPANFLYSDGDALFAHGDRRLNAETNRAEAPGLVYLQRHCDQGAGGIATSGLSIEGADQTMLILASVPLNSGPWQPLMEGEVIAVSAGRIAIRSSADAGLTNLRNVAFGGGCGSRRDQ